ncbi:MAG: hypothetical protein NTV54_12310 [Ignavibacteriales bacterium]|nr:hypothetical protein [Ignavibacteriales bacterium]
MNRIVFFFLAACASALSAQVRLPAVFSSNMVLQRNVEIPVWGWASPGEAISVSFNGTIVRAITDTGGIWTVSLAPMKEGGPYELLVRGSNEIRLKNVMVGVVWFCSGQSNMELSVAKAANAENEIAAAAHPMIRLFTVKRAVAETPQTDCSGRWDVCSPKTVPGFSAASYYFGCELQSKLGITVGLIHSSYGGSPIEAWMTPDALNSDPDFLSILDRWKKSVAVYPEKKKEFDLRRSELLNAWQADSVKAAKEGSAPPPRPQEPLGPGSKSTPSGLYHAMVAPVLPFAVEGILWYQGESNVSRPYLYRKLFPALIQDWRKLWKKELPFYYVQLPNLKRAPEPSRSGWAELREAQLMTLALPKTGMAVTIDIGDPMNLHPGNKQDVGLRLAGIAEALTYALPVGYCGPLYRSARVDGASMRISFDYAEKLRAADGKPLTGFMIAGSDQLFVSADARIDGSSVIVSSASIAQPASVRYAWGDNPSCNLTNDTGIPASPFRTDDWREPVLDKK